MNVKKWGPSPNEMVEYKDSRMSVKCLITGRKLGF